MTCREVIELLNKNFPESMALEWDNPGLITGRMDKEVNKVYVCVDVTDDTLEEAVSLGADMIISHHPLIFRSVRKINSEDFLGRRLMKLIANDVSYYAMHTNFDVCGMADYAASLLGLEEVAPLEVIAEGDNGKLGIGSVGTFAIEKSLRECAEAVKNAFQIEHVLVYGNLDMKVKRVAMCPGSGKSTYKEAFDFGADVYITGDTDHHAGIDAVAQNMAVIDGGHYGIEKIFIPYMKNFLERETSLTVYREEYKNPYTVV